LDDHNRLIDEEIERIEVYCFKISVCVDVGYEAGAILSLTLEDAYEG